MASFQIACIRPDGADADRRIDRLGGFRTDGTRWNDSIDAVIIWIDAGHTFWTEVLGRRVRVEKRQHPMTRRWFLQTEADQFPNNNLLRLPRCP